MSEEGFTPESTEIATPETDHLENQMGEASRHSHPILWEHSRKLERERDKARHEIVGWRNKWECAIEMGARAAVDLDGLRYIAERALALAAINEDEK